VKDWQCDAAYSKVLEKAAKQKEQMQDVIDAKAREYEEIRDVAAQRSIERTDTIREIYKTIPAPPADCPTPPDDVIGVLIESIRDTDAPEAPRQSGAPVQEPE
jgi:hypothetical protein